MLNMRDDMKLVTVTAATLEVLNGALIEKRVQGVSEILHAVGEFLLESSHLRLSEYAKRVDEVVCRLPLRLSAEQCEYVRHKLSSSLYHAAPVVTLFETRVSQMMADAFTTRTAFPSVKMNGVVFAIIRPRAHKHIKVISNVKRVSLAVHAETYTRLILQEARKLEDVADLVL